LQLAIAHVWIVEGLYDNAYIKPIPSAFEHFVRYVLGDEDGIPKTPKWASAKCGVASRIIKSLARTWASQKTTIAHGNGGPGIRDLILPKTAGSKVFLLAMQGLGKPGAHQVKMLEWGRRSLNESESDAGRCDNSQGYVGLYRRHDILPLSKKPEQERGVGGKDVSQGISVPKQFLPKRFDP